MASYHLPWNQAETYWLCLWADDRLPAPFVKELAAFHPVSDADMHYIALPRLWAPRWQELRTLIRHKGPAVGIHCALVGSAERPERSEIRLHEKPLPILDGIAQNLWLGEALLQDRFVSYLQKVVDRRDKPFGYEAFGRMQDEAGKLVDGATLFRASKGLQVEHLLDRHLHVQAIETFIGSDLSGFLFINMLPGFIHRPEKYLQGLQETVRTLGMPSKHLVLDIPHADLGFEPRHLRAIIDYCRSQGYSTAVDDITSIAIGQDVLRFMQPDFVKIDIKLVQQIDQHAKMQEVVQIVKLAQQAGVTTVAEGVETAHQHELLLQAGVDLFQGYLFGKPEAVTRQTNAATA